MDKRNISFIFPLKKNNLDDAAGGKYFLSMHTVTNRWVLWSNSPRAKGTLVYQLSVVSVLRSPIKPPGTKPWPPSCSPPNSLYITFSEALQSPSQLSWPIYTEKFQVYPLLAHNHIPWYHVYGIFVDFTGGNSNALGIKSYFHQHHLNARCICIFEALYEHILGVFNCMQTIVSCFIIVCKMPHCQ